MNIETELRAALADEVRFTVGVGDPYPAVAEHISRRRRTGRIRAAGTAAAVLAAVGVEMMSRAHTDRLIPASTIPLDELRQSPLRGSLAQNQKFVDAMRSKVSTDGKAEILYASDIGNWSLVMAFNPHSLGGAPSLLWFSGARGTSASGMEKNPGELAEPGGSSFYAAGDNGAGAAVVVGPVGYTASVSSGNNTRYTPEGTVEQYVAAATGKEGSGLVEAVLPMQPAPPTLTGQLTRDGKAFGAAYGVNNWSESGVSNAKYVAKVRAALGGRTFAEERLAGWLKDSLDRARLPLKSTDLTVRWVGTHQGRQAALFTV
ncbi:hypothetical protein GCM10022223_52660 [Kineosporia mesophila]|uniref:Uncharacterized protein n=1 Tax=Kineosporia mesophila TaxID=566012 RepID=A0ABP7AB70_9ACTN|nr:hypothetical protein [Kineosporia mesophila]MCD5351350.1 hypothetical protein [Kineosporia mesophila]